ncbi:hypothetical protein SO802_012928 [Lithocarpus litseifolius]|uniref:Uncharacterized protein n=1 Tax=Lithocarpus litseifolius TaxID=425828 RepID=A0AAW2D4S0_9ROSI
MILASSEKRLLGGRANHHPQAGRIKEAIANLPVATEDDDRDEAAALQDETESTDEDGAMKQDVLVGVPAEAFGRVRSIWAQRYTFYFIDILVKHAFDNVARFTTRQRDAIEKLWASIREQQTHRKQGKSVNGKLDVNGFEWLQQKYSTEKISIRHSVGGSGDRHAQQWLV